MMEQLFTVRCEKSGNGRERTEQLFTVRRETEGRGEADRDRDGGQR
jgi:hypothetical protein